MSPSAAEALVDALKAGAAALDHDQVYGQQAKRMDLLLDFAKLVEKHFQR